MRKTYKFKYIIICLAAILYLSSCRFSNNKSKIDYDTPTNLPKLIRIAYDLTNDPSFPEISKQITDSVLTRKRTKEDLIGSFFELRTGTAINEITREVDWILWYDDDDFIPLVPDRLYLNIYIGKNNYARMQDTIVQFLGIRDIASKYIFYPDSSHRKYTHNKMHIEQLGEVETHRVAAIFKLDVDQINTYTINDWKFFFSCLKELITLFEDERNKASLKVWGKSYDALTFEEKDLTAEFSGYIIMIRFYSYFSEEIRNKYKTHERL